MIADPSTQIQFPEGFDLGADDSPPMKRLIIEPDQDDIDWSHLRTILAVCALQDLPHPLRRKLLQLVRSLRASEITRALFDVANPFEIRVNQPKKIVGILVHRIPTSFKVTFERTLWWIEYIARLDIARKRARQGIRLGREYWRCPECGADVGSERDWCKTRGCSSWSILCECTGLMNQTPLSEAV
jgi:hypothetical protein